MHSPVLILNANYEPLNVCDTKRAMILIVLGKAEILENGRGYIHTPSAVFPRPSVIRLAYIIKRPRFRVKLNRTEIFRRDNYTCQYCGLKTNQLTVDHVIPRHRAGEHCWENLVSACPACNRRKGGKTLEQARMHLIRRPYEPSATGSYLFASYLGRNKEWEKFIEGW